MNDDVSLCAHLAAGVGAPAFAISPEEVVAWQDGPVEAIVRCTVCAAPAWLELLDWSRDRSMRVFALAGLRGRDAALYLRNAGKGSCDPKRGRAELEALAAAAGRFERLVAWDVREERVLATVPFPSHRSVPPGGWTERLAAPEDATWFEYLGLDKAAAR